MRGKISDQDLTNYALNDGLEPRERLYVESMLGVSEECRHDVYRMLDLAEMLEGGFESAQEETLPGLTLEQRARLLNPPLVNGTIVFLRRSAASLALAACVALALTNPQYWHMGQGSRRVAAGAAKVSEMVSEAMAANETDIAAWVNPPTVSANDDDSGALLQTVSDTLPPPAETICTPPSAPQTMDYSIPE